ncbi:Putative kinase [Komagataella phaffii CBS 7435]|uniref:Kinase n=2 Tax=Komagataella phaffii TaxID=460519 RepID=C4R278_KOMPG|nr:Putative kinase [Komagataella phaffii GS115]AOA62838.1 GQ67_01023T0 [Komagataella phaffii]CAH2447849.1 Putative kinase [Komagataella phaffii CBS 7435]AOA68034.1 GQ68_00366T0 [Komagataella phaffii GS115]CAY69602.1 Putative kinase [Komagataella phaffii GS115]CCA38017.1 Putative kinase [Komagataella phaffii CBS 7435]
MSKNNLKSSRSRSFTNPNFHLNISELHQNFATPVYYVGVDVGSGSARAAVVDQAGAILGLAEKPISKYTPKADYVNQSSTEIWEAVSYCVKTALTQSHIDPALVMGIGFDATCSLVVLDEETDEPIAVGPDFTESEQNIIMWMDHRAHEETKAINRTGDKCLKYVGGQMSIEMELPKMKWLKHHLPRDETGKSLFERCKFYDLADFLTHKATNTETRSYCSVTCKQGFVPQGVDGSVDGWSKEFLAQVELPELAANDFQKLGGIPGKNGKYLSAGDSVGPLSADAAEQLGLTTACWVASGVIDCYAGWVGTIAAKTEIPLPDLVEQDNNFSGIDKACGRLAAVAGTSTCHCVMSKDPIFVHGVWGPYRDVMAKDYWLAEGGQSCTGALLAHVLTTHPAYTELGKASESSGLSRFDFLNNRLENLKRSRKERSVLALGKDLFFYGDYHGNRSPLADPDMKASIIGQSMDTSLDSLAIEYLGACEFIAQQTRQIVEKMEKSGHNISCIFLSGGQCRNGLLMRLLADCTGLPIIIPRYIEASVVFGSALLGAVAADDAILAQNKGRTGRTVRSSSNVSEPPHEMPPSPYTAPTATASMTSISAMNAPNLSGAPGGFPFPLMTPIEDESKQLGFEDGVEDNTSSDEETLSFGTKNKNQANVQTNFVQQRTSQKPLVSSKPSKLGEERSGDRLWKVMESLSGVGKVIMPSSPNEPDRKLLNTKYKVFLDQAESQMRYRKLVADTEEAIKAYMNI